MFCINQTTKAFIPTLDSNSFMAAFIHPILSQGLFDSIKLVLTQIKGFTHKVCNFFF